MGSMTSFIRSPLGVGLALVVLVILAGLTAAAAISGALTAAAVSAAGLVSVVMIVWMVNKTSGS